MRPPGRREALGVLEQLHAGRAAEGHQPELFGVGLVDDVLGDLTDDLREALGGDSLEPGQSVTIEVTQTVGVADVGELVNVALVSGTDSGGTTVTDEDEAVRIANGTVYGLAGGVWSADQERAKAVALRLRTGQVEVNGGSFNPSAPFGGYRQSGIGREFSLEGMLDSFTQKKNVTVTSGMTIEFFISVCMWLRRRLAPTSYMQKPTWMRNMMTTVTQ